MYCHITILIIHFNVTWSFINFFRLTPTPHVQQQQRSSAAAAAAAAAVATAASLGGGRSIVPLSSSTSPLLAQSNYHNSVATCSSNSGGLGYSNSISYTGGFGIDSKPGINLELSPSFVLPTDIKSEHLFPARPQPTRCQCYKHLYSRFTNIIDVFYIIFVLFSLTDICCVTVFHLRIF